ncbi:DNA-processing protein DprA [Luteococcus sanguinis]|uniref:DNA-processing protein DprA n=1 Tax=Luteococcus sanguinis TaxID=174038 RepID=A0ABW1X5F2_9ACTN
MDTSIQFPEGDRAARVMIATAFEPGDRVTGALLREVGPTATLHLADADGPVPGLDEERAAAWRAQARVNPDRAGRVLADSDRLGLRILIPGDPDWPVALDQLGDRAPAVIWAKGNTDLLRAPAPAAISMVGARAATRYGQDAATEIAAELAEQRIPIISGGAYGIDATSHRATLLHGGSTIAVLPGGLDRPYPTGNADLFDRIATSGLLVSEIPSGSAPTKWRLMQRGRIMAALSAGVVVVEAGYRSSALHVVREAASLGRRVGAVPGPITSSASAGSNRLLQSGEAEMITSASDVVATILWGQGYTAERNHALPAEQAPRTPSPPSPLGR